MTKSIQRVGGLVGGCVLLLIMGACQADYAADITNKTPQPVFVNIYKKGGDSAVLGASRRLGPGDRAFVGPVRTNKKSGAYLEIDMMPNPGRPASVDMLPGTSYYEVQQDGTTAGSPMRVIEKP